MVSEKFEGFFSSGGLTGALHISVLPLVGPVGLEVGSLYSFSGLLGINSQTSGLSQVN